MQDKKLYTLSTLITVAGCKYHAHGRKAFGDAINCKMGEPSWDTRRFRLEKEPENVYNPLAVAVYFDNYKLGYIPDDRLAEQTSAIEDIEEFVESTGNTLNWLYTVDHVSWDGDRVVWAKLLATTDVWLTDAEVATLND